MIAPWIYACIAAALMAVSGGGAWVVQGWRSEAALATLRSQVSEEARVASEAARETEQLRRRAAQKVVDGTRLEAQSAHRDAAGAAAVAGVLADRLRAAADAPGQAACDSGPSGRGLAASAPDLVSANVFSRLDPLLRELAAAYDQARLAGQTCEHIHHTLTQELRH